jgi:cytochrome c5
MQEPDQHSSPIKTPKQLVIVVLLAFIVPIVIIGLLSQLFTSMSEDTSADEQRVLERIKPVGMVVIAEATGPKGSLTGEQVYGQICKTCHEGGLAGAPKTGDKAAWGPRIAQGEKVLVQHAIAGYQGKSGVMPPKGGNADLTDEEVHRAVVYLANQAGASWKEPPPTAVAATSTAGASSPATAASAAPVQQTASGGTPTTGSVGAPSPTATAAAAAPSTAAAPPPAAAAANVAAAAPAGGSSDGKAVYEKVCSVCHATGLAGAPKFGDKAAWAPRIATGINTLHQSALKGKNAMPPKGGNTALSDADVTAAVDYMVSAAK